MKHLDTVRSLGELMGRYESALTLMTQVVYEVEHANGWQAMRTRFHDLEGRIARICNETQVYLNEQHTNGRRDHERPSRTRGAA